MMCVVPSRYGVCAGDRRECLVLVNDARFLGAMTVDEIGNGSLDDG